MPTQAIRVFRGSAAGRAAVLLGAWVVLGASGCAHQYYQATNMPAEFVAPPTTNVSTDLISRLADDTAGSDVIGPGDLLSVTVDSGYGEGPATPTPVWVAEDGTTRVPLIGPVRVAGLTPRDAGPLIAAAAVERGIYGDRYLCVTVEMKEQRTNHVRIIGAVRSPGVKQLPRGSSDLLSALVAAGNLSEKASPEIQIIRCHGGRNSVSPGPRRVADGPQAELTSYGVANSQGPRSISVNLVSMADQPAEDYYLEDGDVVVVRERDPRSIHVIGLVKEPGEYDLPLDRDLHLLNALALAGDRTSQLADKVWVIRRVPGQEEPVRIQASVREAKRDASANVRLASGDVVSVEETPATFVLDLLRNFIRFGLSSSVPLF